MWICYLRTNVCSERAVVSREFQEDQYTAGEYVLAKMLAELPWDAAVASSFAFVLHQVAGLGGTRGEFVTSLALAGCVCR